MKQKKLIPYSQIPRVRQTWRMNLFLPDDEAVVLVGPRGIGKGMLESKITAIETTGRPYPGSDEWREPANVILATKEDDPQKAMGWRLDATDPPADDTRVYNGTNLPPMPDLIPALQNQIADIGNVSTVILDPFASYSGMPLTAPADKIRNELMEPLRLEVANKLGVLLLCTVHVTKAGKTVGSGAIEDVPRLVLRVDRLRSNPSIRDWRVEKSNIGSDEAHMYYTVIGDTPTDGHVIFLDDLESPEVTTEPRERILDVLRDATEPMTARAIGQAARVPNGNTRQILSRLAQEEGSGVFRPRRGLYRSQEGVTATGAPVLAPVS